jgi:hypothetical protein
MQGGYNMQGQQGGQNNGMGMNMPPQQYGGPQGQGQVVLPYYLYY